MGSLVQFPGGRRPMLTVDDVAEYLSVSSRTVATMVSNGLLPSYKIGGSRRIAADDLDAYLADSRGGVA